MSRAFVKEDVDIPEPSGRKRSASGLPPGALNYMTAEGARRLREKLGELQKAGNATGAAELAQSLESATIVERPEVRTEVVIFGATVTVRRADGVEETFRIVGVDEVGLFEDVVSWVSPLGRSLLGAEVGERLALGGDGGAMARVEKIG